MVADIKMGSFCAKINTGREIVSPVKNDDEDQALEDFIEMDFQKVEIAQKKRQEKEKAETTKEEEWQRDQESASHKTESCTDLPHCSPVSVLISESKGLRESKSEDSVLNQVKPDESKEYRSKSAQGITPHPSSGITTADSKKQTSRILDASKDKDLKALLRLVCGATNNSSLGDCAIINLHLHRASCLTPDFQGALISLATIVDLLSLLDLSGNRAGPVAVRALIQTLLDCDVVEELNLADNLADSDCTDLLKQLIKQSKNMCSLNVSGNLLGKESLSRCLSESMASNSTLVKLNISSCGALNLHGLFEGLETALIDGKSTLEYLDMSNNETKDGLLLGKDIATVLQHSSCKLNHLNVENTGLNPAGWDAVIGGLKCNKSIRELHAGGASNQVTNPLKIVEILFSSKYMSAVNLKDLSVAEKLQNESPIVIVDNPEPELSVMRLNLAHCNVSDALLAAMALAYAGKLPNLTWLDLSNNSELSTKGITAFKRLTLCDGNSILHTLLLSGVKLGNVKDIFSDSFAGLSEVSLSKTRIALIELCKLPEATKELNKLTLDGIKLGQSNVISSICADSARYNFTSLSLHGCGLGDADLKPLIQAITARIAAVEKLSLLDLSVNRISVAVKDLASALQSAVHPLETLNLANNSIGDEEAQAISQYLLSKHQTQKLKVLHISYNHLSKKGLLALMNTVCSNQSTAGLVSLDVSHQKHSLSEDELEDVCEALVAAIGLDPERALHEAVEPVPQLPVGFSVNLTDLGGSVGPLARLMDSVAIKTDFTKVCNTSPSLSDYLLISRGLKRSRASTSIDSPMFHSQQWTAIIGPDAPAWLKIEEERKKGVYVSHLPGSATLQRLQGILESEADCNVSQAVFIRDPALLKQSGAAWVLFDDEQSVKQAIEWYARGEAHIFGTAFCISAIPATVASYDESVTAESEKEKETLEIERKRKEESDRIMMEENQQLAEERAAYREAHPAYQNGRIW